MACSFIKSRTKKMYIIRMYDHREILYRSSECNPIEYLRTAMIKIHTVTVLKIKIKIAICTAATRGIGSVTIEL